MLQIRRMSNLHFAKPINDCLSLFGRHAEAGNPGAVELGSTAASPFQPSQQATNFAWPEAAGSGDRRVHVDCSDAATGSASFALRDERFRLVPVGAGHCTPGDREYGCHHCVVGIQLTSSYAAKRAHVTVPRQDRLAILA